VSGHRRHAAAKVAGLRVVPCRYVDVHRGKEPDKFLTLLRECNLQREKTRDERLREEIGSIDPDDAYASLIEHRKEASRMHPAPMVIEGKAHRCKISEAKTPMIEAIKRVLEERREFLPLTCRMIHYALLNDPPLKHASKPDSTYGNDPQSYDALTDLLTRARLAGLIPMSSIGDETRPVTIWGTHKTVGEFIADQQAKYLQGYWRDLLQSQPNHIEIVAEKNTLAPIIRPVAAKYTIATTTGRGFCSLPPRHALAERFKASGKENLVVLVISDFDPDGEEIASSFARSMPS